MLQVCLYTRRGCRLCDDTRPMIELLRAEFLFSLEIIDIESDPQLFARFGCSIPVVTIDGGNRVAARLSTARLRQSFNRALQRRAERENLSASPST